MRAENKVIIQNKGTAINYFSNIRPQFVLRARCELLLHWHGWGGLKWIPVSEYIFVKTIIKSNFRFFLEINFLRWKERCSKYLAYKSAIMRSIDVTFCRFRSVIFLFHFSHNVSCVHYLVTVTDRNDFFKYVIFQFFFLFFVTKIRNTRSILLFIINLTHLIGSTRSEVECIEESGTSVDDKYCKPIPRPDDRQKTCNEDPCPPTWVNSDLFLGIWWGRKILFLPWQKNEGVWRGNNLADEDENLLAFVWCPVKRIERIQLSNLQDYNIWYRLISLACVCKSVKQIKVTWCSDAFKGSSIYSCWGKNYKAFQNPLLATKQKFGLSIQWRHYMDENAACNDFNKFSLIFMSDYKAYHKITWNWQVRLIGDLGQHV